MVISAGMMSPALSCVRALYDLQNSMMFTPCWPSAGPTGGAGFAAPAGHCSFTMATTFFATLVCSYPGGLRLTLHRRSSNHRGIPKDVDLPHASWARALGV